MLRTCEEHFGAVVVYEPRAPYELDCPICKTENRLLEEQAAEEANRRTEALNIKVHERDLEITLLKLAVADLKETLEMLR